MNRGSPPRPAAAVALTAALFLLTGGCARIVTVPPAEVGQLDDPAWTVRQTPTGVTPIGGAPAVSFQARPEVQQAIHSAPDEYGIPSGLYAVDPLLAAHRRELQSEAHARHAAAAGTIVFGLICGGLAAGAIAIGERQINSPDMQTQSSAAQAVLWGGLAGALALGEVIAGTIMAFSGESPRPLQSYYRETYTDPR